MEILLLIAGALIGWIVTHVYSKKASSEQTKLFDKLSVEVRNIILNDSRAKLSVRELNAALIEKTMDLNNPGILAYKACASCGVEDLERIIYWTDEFDVNCEYYHTVKCKACGWKTQIKTMSEVLDECKGWKTGPHPDLAK